MDNQELIKRLTKLAQLDVDMVKAYDQALEKIAWEDVRNNLAKFRDDHRQHVSDLNQHIRDLGGEVVKETPDLRGLLLEGFTALRSVTGTEGALNAMLTTEKITKKTYEEALKEKDLPIEVQSLLIKNCNDEKRQLAYIEQELTQKSWSAYF